MLLGQVAIYQGIVFYCYFLFQTSAFHFFFARNQEYSSKADIFFLPKTRLQATVVTRTTMTNYPADSKNEIKNEI